MIWRYRFVHCVPVRISSVAVPLRVSRGSHVVRHQAVAEFTRRVVGPAMAAAVGDENLKLLGEGRKVQCPSLRGGATVNEQQRLALAKDFVIDPEPVCLDVRSCRYDDSLSRCLSPICQVVGSNPLV